MTPINAPQHELPGEIPGTEWLRDFRKQILTWFSRNSRDLPWRATRDPYAIWISEIMLQQTQVETVKPFFRRFLERFPTIAELAAAEEHEVLRHWEGLGYYRRARQLHLAAQRLVADHAGRFPGDAESVQALPGIGRYTSGAILSIAFGLPEPILEANTIRLYSRLIGYADDPTKSAGQRRLWDFAQAIVTRDQPGMLNQAVMELGSLVCTPKSPACPTCAVRELCYTFRHQLQQSIPKSGKRIVFEDLHEVAVVLRHDRHILLRQCQPGERWAGLWDFPRFPHPQAIEDNAWTGIALEIRQRTGVELGSASLLTTIRHGVTRYRITLDCYLAELAERPDGVRDGHAMVWVPDTQLESYPLSSTGRKICRLMSVTGKPVRRMSKRSTNGLSGGGEPPDQELPTGPARRKRPKIG